jgi:hypothetical protein
MERVNRFRISPGYAGWVRYDADNCPPCYLRFVPNERSRWVVRELFLDASEADEPITAVLLSRIPVATIESLVNSDDSLRSQVEREANASDSPVGGPATGSNVSVLASRYSTVYTPRADPARDWLVHASRATGHASRKKSRLLEPLTEPDTYRLDSGPIKADGLSDEFLTRLKRAYTAASLRGEPPNKTIAEDLGPGTSVRSVERWVYEARKRGIMPPARARGARG